MRDDRLLVPDPRFVTVGVLQAIFFAPHVFHVEALQVGGPAFVDPHVGYIGGGDGVAEPFVPAFVDDDEVEPRADADAGPVAPQVAVGEVVAVSDGGLVLHAGVRHFDQFVAILLEGVFAEVVLVGFDHSLGLRELLLGFLQVFRQSIKIERQAAEFVGEMLVLADVQRNVVVVDGVVNHPLPAGVAVTQIGLAHELAVGDVHQAVGDGDAELHVLHLVTPLVLVGPPEAGADALAGGEDPRPAGGVLAEGEAAKPAGRLRRSGIVEVNRIGAAGFESFGKVHEDGAQFAFVLERGRAHQDLVHAEVGEEIKLDTSIILEHLEADGVLPGDHLLFRVDAHVQMVEEQIVVGAIPAVFATEDIGLRGRGGLSWRGSLRCLGGNQSWGTQQ